MILKMNYFPSGEIPGKNRLWKGCVSTIVKKKEKTVSSIELACHSVVMQFTVRARH